jgi:hypothetical protein
MLSLIDGEDKMWNPVGWYSCGLSNKAEIESRDQVVAINIVRVLMLIVFRPT